MPNIFVHLRFGVIPELCYAVLTEVSRNIPSVNLSLLDARN